MDITEKSTTSRLHAAADRLNAVLDQIVEVERGIRQALRDDYDAGCERRETIITGLAPGVGLTGGPLTVSISEVRSGDTGTVLADADWLRRTSFELDDLISRLRSAGNR